MALDETLIIGIAAVLVAVCMPFILRALKKGETAVITTNNYYNLSNSVTSLDKKVDKNSEDLRRGQEKLADEYRRDMTEVNKTFSLVGGDVKLHTNQLAELNIELGKLEERVRKTENDIIRNARETQR